MTAIPHGTILTLQDQCKINALGECTPTKKGRMPTMFLVPSNTFLLDCKKFQTRLIFISKEVCYQISIVLCTLENFSKIM